MLVYALFTDILNINKLLQTRVISQFLEHYIYQHLKVHYIA